MRLIDADALEYGSASTGEYFFEYVAKYQIDNAPTINTAPERHAKWIDAGNKTVCSRCNGSISFSLVGGKWKYGLYCQTCGAKMDEEETEQWTE